jgi:hypothetical protein
MGVCANNAMPWALADGQSPNAPPLPVGRAVAPAFWPAGSRNFPVPYFLALAFPLPHLGLFTPKSNLVRVVHTFENYEPSPKG